MPEQKQARLAILMSYDQQEWTPVKPEDVPDWVKEPDVMGRLVAGLMARNDRGGIVVADGVRPWYRAERLFDSQADANAYHAAQAKRARRNAKSAGAVH